MGAVPYEIPGTYVQGNTTQQYVQVHTERTAVSPRAAVRERRRDGPRWTERARGQRRAIVICFVFFLIAWLSSTNIKTHTILRV